MSSALSRQLFFPFDRDSIGLESKAPLIQTAQVCQLISKNCSASLTVLQATFTRKEESMLLPNGEGLYQRLAMEKFRTT